MAARSPSSQREEFFRGSDATELTAACLPATSDDDRRHEVAMNDATREEAGGAGIDVLTALPWDVALRSSSLTATARDDDEPSYFTQSAVACLPLTPLISQ